ERFVRAGTDPQRRRKPIRASPNSLACRYFPRMTFTRLRLWVLAFAFWASILWASLAGANHIDADRLTHLDEFDPFWPGLHFPKLTSPQWIGEPGVEAVVILSIDDMSATEPYEKFLRPILERLKKSNGHAPLSILCVA